jgi:ABC-type uncharacterized transport system fused permease/ATPase subunit
MTVKSNVAVVLFAIYISRKIAESKEPKLRFPKSNKSTDNKAKQFSFQWIFNTIRTLSYIFSFLGVKESLFTLVVLASLIGRSFLHLKLLYLSTAIENGVVNKQRNKFWNALKEYSFYMLPTSFLFALYNYSLSELALNIRNNITKRLLTKYSNDSVYYQIGQSQSNITDSHKDHEQSDSLLSNKLSNQKNQKEITTYSNPEQILTNDLEEFSLALTNLFSNVLRPTVDILINAQRLSFTSGLIIPVTMMSYLIVTSTILNFIRNPIGDFINGEQQLEGTRYSDIREFSVTNLFMTVLPPCDRCAVYISFVTAVISLLA